MKGEPEKATNALAEATQQYRWRCYFRIKRCENLGASLKRQCLNKIKYARGWEVYHIMHTFRQQGII